MTSHDSLATRIHRARTGPAVIAVGVMIVVALTGCGNSATSTSAPTTTSVPTTLAAAAPTTPAVLPPTTAVPATSNCVPDRIAVAAGVGADAVGGLQCIGDWAIADICEDPEDCVDATKIFRFDGSAWVLATYLLGNGQRCLDTFAGVGAPTDVAQSFCETSVPSGGGAPVTEPVLGLPWASNQQGYGESAPTVVFNGGSGLGMIQDIAWDSWGGPEARGSGQAIRPGPSGGGADGSLETATIVAFDLGTCPGSDAPAYTGVTWFFPADGSWEVGQGEWTNACTGDTVVGE